MNRFRDCSSSGPRNAVSTDFAEESSQEFRPILVRFLAMLATITGIEFVDRDLGEFQGGDRSSIRPIGG